MDKENVKSVADKAKGAIKDTAGKIMSDTEAQVECEVNKAKGDAHKAVGDLKVAESRKLRR